MQEFDYVIIGAGSAGCVLANRLTEDPDVSVLVLEAGGKDRGWKIHMPAALSHPLADDKVNWFYHSEPEPYMDDRRIYQPRGKVLGGSSSINGMAYVRGHALDYDRWGQQGAVGWSYADCLPYFRKAETFDQGANDYHGDEGPLHVTTGAGQNPLYKAWVEAGQQAGYPFTADMNGRQQEGIGPMFSTTRQGKRCSAAVAYLHPAAGRANLTIEIRAFTLKLLFEGNRCIGVEYHQNGETKQVRAGREVLLCAGAVNSPQTLMLSGVGPAEHLRDVGLGVIQDLPGVGQNLQDHLEIYVQQESVKPVSRYYALKPWHQAWIGALWLAFHTGPGASNQFEAGGFIRSSAGVEHPDLQYHFLPLAVNYDGKNPANCHGYQAHVGPMRPTSTGHVKLKSKDPRDAPEILFNYMKTEQDRREMRAAVRLTREIFAQKAFDPYRGRELAPGEDAKSDAEIDAFVRGHGESAYHPSCTCKMGNDEMAVVDPQCRVRGLEGLRVVDASVMPSIVSGNLNAPTIMLAEKAADMIKGAPPLPPADAEVWVHPDWRREQR